MATAVAEPPSPLRSAEPADLIDYPCAFPIKVMGHNVPGFQEAMLDVARRHDPALDAALLTTRPSKGGKYLGITLTVTATSRAQLDALYRSLSSHPMVKVVL
jgi:uncharacterized protein